MALPPITPTSIEVTSPPMAPSMVLPGEMGDSDRLPSLRPITYAPMSVPTTMKQAVRVRARPMPSGSCRSRIQWLGRKPR
jgi:hypothetical protein